MPNTKSAERRVRRTTRRELINRRAKSRLRTLESNFLTTIEDGNKEEAAEALKVVTSALDKACKVGVVHRAAASRKKSRYANRFNKLA